jgi:hypothetical protein
MRINVTQEDIDKGKCNIASECAIARALMRTGEFEHVTVSGLRIIVCRKNNENEELTFYPEMAIGDWIWRFDKLGKKGVAPFSFELTGTHARVINEPEVAPALMMIPAMIPAKKETVHATESIERIEGFRQGSLR